MNDLNDPRNQKLTSDAPLEPHGEPSGAVSGALPVSPGARLTPSAPAGEPQPSQPASQGEPPAGAPAPAPPTAGEPASASPGSALDRWCGRCEVMVTPEGKGRCPVCKSFLPANSVARRHPVNVAKRAVLLAELVADFHPTTSVDRSNCAALAAIQEQLSSCRAGSPEWTRLITSAQTLVGALRAAQSETRPPHDLSGLDAMATSHLQAAKEYLDRQQAGETLSERELGRLDVLQDAMAGRVQLPTASEARSVANPRPVDEDFSESGVADAAPSVQQETGCPYCHRSPCIGPEHPAFATLHYNDPTEVERRRVEATAVMLATMSHGSGVTTW